MTSSAQSTQIKRQRVAIIGAGIIGLACAFELSRQGVHITLYDKGEPGRGASWAAAGMLAPAFEAGGEPDAHPHLLDICLESARLWPAFANRLEAFTRRETGYFAGPSLALARTPSDGMVLERIAASLQSRGLPYQELMPAKARKRQPGLGSNFERALELPSDGQVDNRLVVSALVQACEASANIELDLNCSDISLPKLQQGYDQVIVTAGWQSANLFKKRVPVRPVGGQLLSVRHPTGMSNTALRCGALYIAPKQDRVVIGATVEPGKVAKRVDETAISDLKERAAMLCPALGGAETIEAWSGTRPGTPDGAPIIQRIEDNVILASGHYRNGILLAPLTAQWVSDLVLERAVPKFLPAFSGQRFQSVSA